MFRKENRDFPGSIQKRKKMGPSFSSFLTRDLPEQAHLVRFLPRPISQVINIPVYPSTFPGNFVKIPKILQNWPPCEKNRKKHSFLRALCPSRLFFGVQGVRPLVGVWGGGGNAPRDALAL